MSNKIREANLGDSDIINELSNHLEYEAVSDEVASGRLKTILDSNDENIWIIESDGKIHGWLHVFIAHRVASPTFVEIGGLVILPESRRKGVGSALVGYAINWAKDQNLSLRVRCNSKRKEAHRFYESVGFIKMKVQNIYESCCT
ncbi:MAG: GNAT family N-acetyltransferase [candidate division Zixibacteria bacterium]|nr:GNAT family N-acetyltransferase [candidate division Zixibacteria bacterium]